MAEEKPPQSDLEVIVTVPDENDDQAATNDFDRSTDDETRSFLTHEGQEPGPSSQCVSSGTGTPELENVMEAGKENDEKKSFTRKNLLSASDIAKLKELLILQRLLRAMKAGSKDKVKTLLGDLKEHEVYTSGEGSGTTSENVMEAGKENDDEKKALLRLWQKICLLENPENVIPGLPGYKLKKDEEKALLCLVKELRRLENAIPGFSGYKLNRDNILHVALLMDKKEVSDMIIKDFPERISDKCSSKEFKDQTAFHIAASKGQCETLELMLKHCTGEKHELLSTKATGTHFKDVNPAGTLPLTAAAWAGHCEMLGMLIEEGADLEGRLDNGNTVLHYIVTQSALYPKSDTSKKLFDKVWEKCTKWWESKHPGKHAGPGNTEPDEMTPRLQTEVFRYLLAIKNYANQNILALSINCVSNSLTKHILNMEPVFKQSKTSRDTSWSTYDVTEVTSFSPPGETCRYNSDSVLHILGHMTDLAIKHEDLDDDLIEEEPIKSLLRMKWGMYRFVYITWCLVHFLLMLVLSIVSLYFHKPKENKTAKLASDENAIGNATYGAVKESPTGTGERHVHFWYLVFGIVALIYLALEIADISSAGWNAFEHRNKICSCLESKQGSKNSPAKKRQNTCRKRKSRRVLRNVWQWSATGNAPYRIQLLFFSVFVLIWIGLHLIRSDDQDIPLSFAMILGWLFMLFFTRACPSICRFSVMMEKMFFHDCIYFFVIFVFFWLAFSTALHVLFVDGTRPDLQVWNTLFGMLNLVTDAGEKAAGEHARVPVLGAVLLNIYAVVSVILLLNMLIAMMNTSYEVVKGSKINICRYQQLSIMLMLERRLWWWEWLCDRSQEKVSPGEHDARFYLKTEDIPQCNDPNEGNDRNKQDDGPNKGNDRNKQDDGPNEGNDRNKQDDGTEIAHL